MEEKPQKSLERWRFELKSIGKRHWLTFYESFMGHAVTSPQRLYRAINLYGDWPVFEAIIESSGRSLTGDSINYVLKVAHEKWKSAQQEIDSDAEYANAVEESKKISHKANLKLAKKLEQRRKRK